MLARAAAREGTGTAVKTVAGELDVVETTPMQAYELRLAGKKIVGANSSDPNDKRADGPIPSIARSFGKLGEFDEVLLVRWDGPGNACDGYGFTFLGLRKDGAFKLSDDIPWCGGPAPVISVSGERVTVSRPKSPPNRGTDEVPAASWIYEAGRVTAK
ncbi:MAG TPA: hypothetical protein VM925_13465 [Labilithrix sp.]|nr:hypothetical protein [Labilithrix sp.]